MQSLTKCYAKQQPKCSENSTGFKIVRHAHTHIRQNSQQMNTHSHLHIMMMAMMMPTHPERFHEMPSPLRARAKSACVGQHKCTSSRDFVWPDTHAPSSDARSNRITGDASSTPLCWRVYEAVRAYTHVVWPSNAEEKGPS